MRRSIDFPDEPTFVRLFYPSGKNFSLRAAYGSLIAKAECQKVKS